MSQVDAVNEGSGRASRQSSISRSSTASSVGSEEDRRVYRCKDNLVLIEERVKVDGEVCKSENISEKASRKEEVGYVTRGEFSSGDVKSSQESNEKPKERRRHSLKELKEAQRSAQKLRAMISDEQAQNPAVQACMGEMRRLEIENSVALERYEALRDELRESKAEALQSSITCKALEESRDKVTSENSKMILQMQAKINVLTKELDTSRQEVIMVQSQFEEMMNHGEGTVDMLEKEKEGLVARAAQYVDTITTLEVVKEELEMKVREREAELQQSKQEKKSVQSELQQSHTAIANLQGELQQSRSDLETNRFELDQSRGELRQAKDEIQKMRSQMEEKDVQHRNEVDALKVVSDQQLQQLQSQLEQYAKDSTRRDAELEECKSQMEQYRHQAEQNHVDLEQYKSGMIQAKVDLEQAASDLEQSKVETDQWKQQVEDLQSEVKTMQSRLQSKDAESEKWNDETSQKHRELQSRIDELASKNLLVQEVQQQLSAKESEMNTEMEDCKKQILDLNQQLAWKDQQLIQAQQENQELAQQQAKAVDEAMLRQQITESVTAQVTQQVTESVTADLTAQWTAHVEEVRANDHTYYDTIFSQKEAEWSAHFNAKTEELEKEMEVQVKENVDLRENLRRMQSPSHPTNVSLSELQQMLELSKQEASLALRDAEKAGQEAENHKREVENQKQKLESYEQQLETVNKQLLEAQTAMSEAQKEVTEAQSAKAKAEAAVGEAVANAEQANLNVITYQEARIDQAYFDQVIQMYEQEVSNYAQALEVVAQKDSELDAKEERIQALNKDITTLNETIQSHQSVSTKAEKLQAETQQLQGEVARLQDRSKSLESDKEEQAREKADIQRLLEETQQALATEQANYQLAYNYAGEKDQTIVERDQTIIEKDQQIQDLEASIQSLQLTLQTGSGEVYDKEKEIQLLQEKTKNLEYKLQQKTDEMNQSQVEISELQNRMESKDRDLQAKDFEMQNKDSEVNELHDKIHLLEQQNQGLEKQCQSTELKSQLIEEEYNSKKQELERKHEELKQEIANLLENEAQVTAENARILQKETEMVKRHEEEVNMNSGTNTPVVSKELYDRMVVEMEEQKYTMEKQTAELVAALEEHRGLYAMAYEQNSQLINQKVELEQQLEQKNENNARDKQLLELQLQTAIEKLTEKTNELTAISVELAEKNQLIESYYTRSTSMGVDTNGNFGELHAPIPPGGHTPMPPGGDPGNPKSAPDEVVLQLKAINKELEDELDEHRSLLVIHQSQKLDLEEKISELNQEMEDLLENKREALQQADLKANRHEREIRQLQEMLKAYETGQVTIDPSGKESLRQVTMVGIPPSTTSSSGTAEVGSGKRSRSPSESLHDLQTKLATMEMQYEDYKLAYEKQEKKLKQVVADLKNAEEKLQEWQNNSAGKKNLLSDSQNEEDPQIEKLRQQIAQLKGEILGYRDEVIEKESSIKILKEEARNAVLENDRLRETITLPLPKVVLGYQGQIKELEEEKLMMLDQIKSKEKALTLTLTETEKLQPKLLELEKEKEKAEKAREDANQEAVEYSGAFNALLKLIEDASGRKFTGVTIGEQEASTIVDQLKSEIDEGSLNPTSISLQHLESLAILLQNREKKIADMKQWAEAYVDKEYISHLLLRYLRAEGVTRIECGRLLSSVLNWSDDIL